MTLIIGLGHYSRTGKDSFANFLMTALRERAPHLRVIKRSMAWKLKQICFELYGWAGVMPPEHYDDPATEKDRDVVLPALGMTPVELWVAFGTKAIRNQVYDRTWLDYLMKTNHGADVLIIPDIRFENEAVAVNESGGVLAKIVRPGYGPRKTVADRMLLRFNGWHYVIGREGTMDSLRVAAEAFADWIAGTGPKPVQTAEERQIALSVAEKIEPWEIPRD